MIYFVQPADGGPIKIGLSADVPRRLRQLENTYGKTLVLLTTMDGDEDVERSLHERFSRLRLGRTEQFRPDPELAEFIGGAVIAAAGEVVEMEKRDLLSSPERDDVAVKVDRAVVTMAKRVAESRGIPVAELLSETLRAPIGQAYARMLRDLDRDGK